MIEFLIDPELKAGAAGECDSEKSDFARVSEVLEFGFRHFSGIAQEARVERVRWEEGAVAVGFQLKYGGHDGRQHRFLENVGVADDFQVLDIPIRCHGEYYCNFSR